jgi:hypothetical protein
LKEFQSTILVFQPAKVGWNIPRVLCLNGWILLCFRIRLRMKQNEERRWTRLSYLFLKLWSLSRFFAPEFGIN